MDSTLCFGMCCPLPCSPHSAPFSVEIVAHLADEEMTANRSGRSNDRKAEAAIQFAIKVVQARGHVCDADVRAVKAAGYDDAQVIEIVQHVGLNTWTNYLNEVAQTEVDFPVVSARKVA